MVMGSGGIPQDVRRDLADRLRQGPEAFGPTWAAGLVAGAAEHNAWLDRRERYRAAFRPFFGAWDALLVPITIVPPFSYTTLLPDRRTYRKATYGDM